MCGALLLNIYAWQFETSIRRSTTNTIPVHSITERRDETLLIEPHVILGGGDPLEHFELFGFCFSQRKWLSHGNQN